MYRPPQNGIDVESKKDTNLFENIQVFCFPSTKCDCSACRLLNDIIINSNGKEMDFFFNMAFPQKEFIFYPYFSYALYVLLL